MQSTLTPQDTDPHDAFVIEPDVVLAARQASPDPVQELLGHLAHKAAGQRASAEVSVVPQVSVSKVSVAPEAPAVAPRPAVDTTFRAALIDVTDRPVVPDDRPGIGWWVKRAFVAFMFALCSAFAAAAWTHHGEAAKQMISRWLPPFVLAATPATDKPVTDDAATDKPPVAEQPGPAPAQAAADQAQAQPPAQAAVQHPDAEATAAAAPAQPAQSPPTTSSPSPSTQSMARDLATMGQQIEQLKASIEQLKAGQAQMSRELARNFEPSPRPRASANPPRPVASIPPRPIPAPRRPRQAYLPPPAVITSSQPSYAVPPALPPLPQPVTSQPMASQPVPLPEATAAPDDGPVIRPPMPLR